MSNIQGIREDLGKILLKMSEVESAFSYVSTDSIVSIEKEIRERKKRIFPEGYFMDVAWDVLTELYDAERSGRKCALSNTGLGSNIPLTTTLRYIAKLERDGFVSRSPDPHDRRRAFLRLTTQGRKAIENVFDLHG